MTNKTRITLLLLLLGNSIQAMGSEPVNLAKTFKNNAVVSASYTQSGKYISLQKRNNEYIYRINQGDDSETVLPWKPTHMQSNKNARSVVFASLRANGHPNAQDALLFYKENKLVLSVNNVISFKLSANGENLFTLRTMNNQLTGEMYNVQGERTAQRTWGTAGGSVAYSISPDGSLFLPKPQSPDIEKWTSIKAFSGSDLKTEQRYSFGEHGILDALALNDDKVLIAVAGAVNLFKKQEPLWQFAAKYKGVTINKLNLSDDAAYVIASDTHSNSFFVIDLTGQLLLEHNDHPQAATEDRMNFLPLRKTNRGLPFNRHYRIQDEHLVITDNTADKIYLIDLDSKKHKVITNAKQVFDLSIKTQQKLIRANGKVSLETF